MRHYYLLLIFAISTISVVAQNPLIENVQVSLSSSNDSMIVKYNITGSTPLSDIHLEIVNTDGLPVYAKSISGDVGNSIKPGNNKTIIWDMAKDSVDYRGTRLFVQVNGYALIKYDIAKKDSWIPWFYIASGVSAATGIFAHIRANNIYTNNYLPSWDTPESEAHNQSIRAWETTRNVALSAAGIFGAVGVVVHIKHRQKIHAFDLNYYPHPKGAEFQLTYNF